jgi:prepilin-type processing-associated H-X9-DG protein/prepilin-type N-terminal cleavage/methylation domain-containing protein
MNTVYGTSAEEIRHPSRSRRDRGGFRAGRRLRFETRSCRIAFTLVELLVVIVIIAIIAALLVPVLRRGRISAQRVRCVANLRQLALAGHMYWDDNGGACFRYRIGSKNGGELYWFGWLANGAEGERAFDLAAGALYPYLLGRGVEICPAFDYFDTRVKLKATGAAYGYGYNWYLSAAPGEPPVKTDRITRPSGTVLFADAAQVNTWQAPASASHPMLEEWYYIDNTTNQPNGHFRHATRANAAFCDGHIASETFVPRSLDARLPGQYVGLFRKEILLLP